MRIRIGSLVASLCLLASPALAESQSPGDVRGVVAWYDIDTLHEKMIDRSRVRVWLDASGNGHDLNFDSKTEAPLFEVEQFGEQPAVRIGRGDRFEVASPFELEDHTIFVVHASGSTARALFRSDADDKRGVLLYQNGRSHGYQDGKMGRLFPYNASEQLGLGPSVTVLARDSGTLTAFVNGRDMSSAKKFEGSIRVGAFFDLELSQFVRRDGGTLQIAEMVFYDRFLTNLERYQVTNHLLEKYGIERDRTQPEGTYRGLFGMDRPVNANQEFVAWSWPRVHKLEGPFRTDPEEQSAVYCTEDGTRVRVQIKVTVSTQVADATVRLFVLKNNEEYLQPPALIGPLIAGEPFPVDFTVTLNMDAGDFFEVVSVKDGAEGAVEVDSPTATLVITELR